MHLYFPTPEKPRCFSPASCPCLGSRPWGASTAAPCHAHSLHPEGSVPPGGAGGTTGNGGFGICLGRFVNMTYVPHVLSATTSFWEAYVTLYIYLPVLPSSKHVVTNIPGLLKHWILSLQDPLFLLGICSKPEVEHGELRQQSNINHSHRSLLRHWAEK